MIIDRFGDTYSTAYQIPQNNAIDDFTDQRPAVSARVGGMNGAFDFYGSNNYPILPLTVRKNFTLVGKRAAYTGAGTITFSSGGHTVTGASTLWLSTLFPGDSVQNTTGGAEAPMIVSTVDSDTQFTSVNPGSGNVTTSAYTVTPPALSRTQVEYVIDLIKSKTISVGESKLWFLRRDGSKHWAYAKCTSLKTADQVGNVYHLPASIEFFCREGVWYNDTLHVTSTSQASASYTISNAGNTYAAVIFAITSSSGTLTELTVTNTTNSDTFTWTGSVSVGNLLNVDSGKYQVLNNSVGAYAGLTYGANQINWLRLSPGSNTITVSVTGSTAWSGAISWYDTYL